MDQLTVYYDELCVLCSKEIHHYQKQTGSENIRFVDITSDKFDAKIEGVDPFEVHQIMHAKKSDGTILTRIAAFQAIWSILPKYRWLHRFSQVKFVKKLMDLGYEVFAAARPYLPKKKKNLCADSPYCELK